MPTPRLPMRKIREVLRLKHDQGLSHRAVARACSLGVGTVTLYLQRATDRGVSWPVPAELDDAVLEARLFPRAAPLRDRVRPDCAEIHRELTRIGVTLLLLWQEYAQVHPDGYRYSQFCEIYRQWSRRLRPSMRQVHRVGEKTFIDFSGKRPTIVDRHTGEERPVDLFVAVLGASSYTYAEATATQQVPDWVGAHTRMVEYFGGATALWVPDQLKSAITRSCRYEPGINRTYEELAAHYGAVVVPARPRKPRDKAAVENGVLLAQRWILARLRHQTFFRLDALNRAIRTLLDELNDRPMQQLGVSRRTRYARLDRPCPPPATSWRIGRPVASTLITMSRSNATSTACPTSSFTNWSRRDTPRRPSSSTTRAAASPRTADTTTASRRPRRSTCPRPTGRMPSGRRRGSSAGLNRPARPPGGW